MRYFNLTNPNSFFKDAALGIIITGKLPFKIESADISNRMLNYINSGFLVELNKAEYDLYALESKSTRNTPFFKSIVSSKNCEELVAGYPTGIEGNSYLAYSDANSEIANKIITFKDNRWVITTPLNKSKVLIDNLGIMATYYGVYPKGRWDYTTQLNEVISDEVIPQTFKDYVIAQLQALADAIIELGSSINPGPTTTVTGDNLMINNSHYTNVSVNSAIEDLADQLDSISIPGTTISKHQVIIDDWIGSSAPYYKEVHHNLGQPIVMVSAIDITSGEVTEVYWKPGNSLGGDTDNYLTVESTSNNPIRLLVIG